MTNTSATGGYLSPIGSPADEDDALAALFQSACAGITGLSGDLVRPRWQVNPPKQPEPSTTWAAIGVTTTTPDFGPCTEASDMTATASRHELIEVLCSFYGPGAQASATRWRDGLAIPQNGDTLRSSGIVFVSCGPSVPAPELVNQQWVRRFDVATTFRRKISNTYNILTFQSGDVSINTDTQ